MVLGLYYLTKAKPGAKGEGRSFAYIDDVVIALEMGEVETLTPIRLRYTGEVIDLTQAFDDQNVIHTEPIEFNARVHGHHRRPRHSERPSAEGRAGVNAMPYINGLLKKKGLGQLVQYCYLKFGLEITVKMLDEIKSLGFLYATRAGISIGIDDMVVPDNKKTLVKDADKAGHRGSAAVSGRRHHQRRALQQDHRNLVGDHRESCR